MSTLTAPAWQFSGRNLYLNFERIIEDRKGKELSLTTRALAREHAKYLISAYVEAAIVFPPAYLLSQFSKAAQSAIKKGSNLLNDFPNLKAHITEISKRKAVQAGVAIEAAFATTPDGFASEILAVTLITSGVLGHIFEKAVGVKRAEKIYAPFKASFNYATAKIPSRFKLTTAKVWDYIKEGVINARRNYNNSPAMTVFNPSFVRKIEP